MAKVTAAEFADKWGRRLKASTEDMKRGAAKVTEAPSKAAIRAKEKMKAKLIASIEDGTWERQLGLVTLDDWQTAFIETGVGRVSGGVDKAGDKMTKFGEWLIPTVEAGQNKIKGMPDVTLDDSISRMVEFTRHMAKNKYKGS